MTDEQQYMVPGVWVRVTAPTEEHLAYKNEVGRIVDVRDFGERRFCETHLKNDTLITFASTELQVVTSDMKSPTVVVVSWQSEAMPVPAWMAYHPDHYVATMLPNMTRRELPVEGIAYNAVCCGCGKPIHQEADSSPGNQSAELS